MKKTLLAVMAMVSLCSYAQTPVEGFESPWVSPGPNMPEAPPGWVVINEFGPIVTWTQSVGNVVDQPPFGGNHAAFLHKENVSPAGPVPKDWLISPIINPQINSQVKFQSRLTLDEDQGSIYKIYAIPGDTDLTTGFNPDPVYLLGTYTELQMNPEQKQWTEKVIAIPQNMAGTPVRIAFVMEGDNQDRWIIDDFTVTNACYAPTNLYVASITDTSVALGWIEQAVATSWEIEVLPAPAVPTGIAGIAANANPFVIANLTPGAYKFYVRSVCGPENKSAWSGPFYFSTDITFNNLVHGVVRYDANGDDICNESDSVLAGASVAVSINGAYAYSVYANEQGEYTLYDIPDGTNSLSLQVSSGIEFPAIPLLTQDVVFDEEINEITIEHCLPQPTPVNNLSVQIIPIVYPRPGFDAKDIVVVQNYGGVINENVTVAFTFDNDRLDYVSSQLPATVSGNIVTIDFGTVVGNKQSLLTFTTKAPPVNMGGETVHFEAALSEIPNDAYLFNNTNSMDQVIVNSYDPNEIVVHEGAEITEDQADDYLTYTIRFQNEGNGDAINIRLEDTLDELLDWDTFEMVTASHPDYTIKRTGGELEFFFPDIQLPFKNADEQGSHGFVTYRIKPTAEFGLGDTVYNQAGIYFDFNPVIMTNTAETKVMTTAGLNENAPAIATLYPNPVKDRFHVKVTQGNLQSVAVYDINGRLCLSVNTEIIDTNALNSGIYFVKVTTDTGSANYKIIKQ
ncbi:DUF7619 domain-containing protein [Flavobacterium hauense]